jgi:hypothetical protein
MLYAMDSWVIWFTAKGGAKTYLKDEGRLAKIGPNGEWYVPVWTTDPADAKSFDQGTANALPANLPRVDGMIGGFETSKR